MSEPRLVTAHDIAKSRTDAMPTGTIEQTLEKMVAYMVEVQNAKAEKARGEWSPGFTMYDPDV